MIAGVGTDIVLISRFEKLSERFMERCYTAREREYLRNKPVSSKAGLFAAKEAAVKALGTGFSGFWPCEAEIVHDENGKPSAEFHGAAKKAADKLDIKKIWVSISHSETDAVAFAVAERG